MVSSMVHENVARANGVLQKLDIDLWPLAGLAPGERPAASFPLVVGTSVQSYGPGCLEEDAVVTHAGRVPGPLATRADPLPQLNNRLFRMFRSVC